MRCAKFTEVDTSAPYNLYVTRWAGKWKARVDEDDCILAAYGPQAIGTASERSLSSDGPTYLGGMLAGFIEALSWDPLFRG